MPNLKITLKLFLIISVVSCGQNQIETVIAKPGDIEIIDARAKSVISPDKKISKYKRTLKSQLVVFADIKNNTNYKISEITFYVIVEFSSRSQNYTFEQTCKKEYGLFKFKPRSTDLVCLTLKKVMGNASTVQELEKAVWNKEVSKNSITKIKVLSFKGVQS